MDAIAPFAAEFAAPGSWAEAAREAASSQPKGARTLPMAERSLGTPDPGAFSFALIVETTAAAVETTG